MNLLLSFFKEHEGQVDKCRGVLACVAVDFSCYNQLCSVHALLMVPVGLLALTTNITWEYMLGATCPYGDPQSTSIQHQIKLMSWSEISMAFFLLLTAVSGIQVTYVHVGWTVDKIHAFAIRPSWPFLESTIPRCLVSTWRVEEFANNCSLFIDRNLHGISPRQRSKRYTPFKILSQPKFYIPLCLDCWTKNPLKGKVVTLT